MASCMGGDVIDEALGGDDAQQVDVIRQRYPRHEGDKRGVEVDARLPADSQGLEKILAVVAFVEQAQNVILHGLDGAGHHEAAGFAQGREELRVPQQVLDFDGDVVGEPGKLAMQFPYQRHGVAGAVEKNRGRRRLCAQPRPPLVAGCPARPRLSARCGNALRKPAR